MPTYEYQCDKCGKQFEYFQGIKDAPKTDCEECGGGLTKLLSGGTGLIFKGSGFYITDYKPKAGEGSSSKSEGASSGSSSGGESKSSGGDSAPKAPAKTESKS